MQEIYIFISLAFQSSGSLTVGTRPLSHIKYMLIVLATRLPTRKIEILWVYLDKTENREEDFCSSSLSSHFKYLRARQRILGLLWLIWI